MKKRGKALITGQALQLGFTLGLALLAVMMVMWSTTARATVPQPRYVDGAPLDDITGHPRDAWPDMGAYEWIGIFLPLVMSN
jgi:hypothetical protein